MAKKILLGIFCALISWSVAAETVELNPDHPQSYVVQKGDTLWGISGRFLRKPWLWPEIWAVNPQIENPHLIFPGDVVTLVYRDGRPVLEVTRGREVRLSPEVRAYPRDDAIQPIPLDAIRQFLTRPRVVSAEELDRAPYVVSSFEEHLIAGTGNRVYVRGAIDEEQLRYVVYRKGEPYYDDPAGGASALLGYEALHVADAILQRTGDPSTFLITTAYREVLVGDRLLPDTEEVIAEFFPHAPDRPLKGSIVSVIDGFSQIGQLQVVVLNLGQQDGLQPGHVMAIFQTGKVVRDTIAPSMPDYKGDRIEFQHEDASPVDSAFSNIFNDVKDTWRAFARKGGAGQSGVPVELPEERIGELMVFRTFDRVSYALVMNLTRPVHVRDAVANP